ncbi:hypothetical protein G7076_09680 [Sphingomonas sp. HDW15A]|uniref:hypothetical protein n=1 Tax=Sphingomonas sp. HDW15A TaxID=2714942 RepID=UPI00140DB93D|nr:hypothetical protein [Sphingomonas sp. HDW15A]QIK96669.1 hypothetical protein G7076_09680 [Sphingomonas sp. HDW15A]
MHILFALPLLVLAAPSVAAPQQGRESIQIPPELTSPETAEKLGNMAGVLSKALMDLKVGEIEAIASGREPTAADKQRTVRDMAVKGDPNFERDVERQVANAGPIIQQSMKRVTAMLPALMSAMEGISDDLDRATANLPDPTYPKR